MSKLPNKKNSRAEGRADPEAIKLVRQSQSNSQSSKSITSIKQRYSEAEIGQFKKGSNFKLSSCLRILLAITLLFLLVYLFYYVHASSNSLQQKINDYDQKNALHQEQLQKIEKGLNQRKVTEGNLVSRLDTINTKIEDDKKQRVNSILWSNKQSSIKDETSIASKTGEGFIITPQVWMFQKLSPRYLDELIIANNKRFASLSNFKVNTLSKSNYQNYLSKGGNQILQNTLKTLREMMDKGNGGLKRHFDQIQKRLIMFSILHERGGVIIDGAVTLTENFDWIRQIQSNAYVNRGNPDAAPQVVGFYSPFYSSEIQKQQKSLLAGMEEVQKYMVRIPGMESYFIAAIKEAEFIGRVLDQMINILLFPESITKDMRENRYEYYRLDGKDIYSQYFFLAGHRVLDGKQQAMDKVNTDPTRSHFAIDYYGLFLINCFYGPYKLSVVYQDVKTPDRKIQNLAKYDLEEFQASVGPMRYLEMPTIFWELNDFLTRARDNKLEKQIMRGSYIQKMYFPETTKPFIYDNPQKWLVNLNARPWNNLTKIIWIYWYVPIADAPVQIFLCVQNLKRMSASSGFVVKEVSNNNLKDYLDPITIQKIEYTLKEKKGRISHFTQTKANLVRLALLNKYGGIYLDASIIAVENFDWLINIAKFPSQYIFNRFGDLPQVLMFWNPNAGGFLEWEVDEAVNTKAGWRYSFENSIIIAVKQSQFIKEWLDLAHQLLRMSPSEIMRVFQACNISNYKWINQTEHYLLSMDTAKCVIGRRQVYINKQHKTEWKNAMDYYKLWSMSTFFGPFKIRSNMNYANLNRYHNNPFFTRYSQEYVEGIIGKMHFMLKFVQQSRKRLTMFIEENFDKIKQETHSQSLFIKYLYDQNLGRFEKDGDRIVFKTNK